MWAVHFGIYDNDVKKDTICQEGEVAKIWHQVLQVRTFSALFISVEKKEIEALFNFTYCDARYGVGAPDTAHHR